MEFCFFIDFANVGRFIEVYYVENDAVVLQMNELPKTKSYFLEKRNQNDAVKELKIGFSFDHSIFNWVNVMGSRG